MNIQDITIITYMRPGDMGYVIYRQGGLYMNFLREKGYSHSFLWTISELVSGLSLYQRNGFTLNEEIASDTFGKTVTEQRYDLFLY